MAGPFRGEPAGQRGRNHRPSSTSGLHVDRLGADDVKRPVRAAGGSSSATARPPEYHRTVQEAVNSARTGPTGTAVRED